MCKVSMRMTKVLVLLAAVFLALSVFPAENALGTDSGMQKAFEFVKEWIIPDIRGSAIWALLGKMATAMVFLGLIFFSYFSQWIHVRWFLKGKPRGVFRLSGAETFGWRVTSAERKKYLMFESPKRQKVIDAINDHCGVFLVMGQAGVGKKSLLIRAKLKAKYVLVVERDEWCDRHSEDQPVKKILKERTALLVNNLLWRRPVCILLTWNSVGTLEAPVPSPEQMQRIIKDLACTLREKKYGKVSFVVIMPAYYQLSGISKEDLGNCRSPEAYSVSLLDCAECRSLLEAQLQSKGAGGEVDVGACRHSLDEEAKRMGLALDRMIWIKSFGMPRYVLEIVSQQQYASVEVWISMCNWWNQVYNEKGKDKWLVYLYVLALKSLMNSGPVNAEELIVKLKDKLFCNNGDRLEKAEEALRLMCINRRHGNGRINAHTLPGKRQGTSFDLRKVDAGLVFEDPYVIEYFVGTLGYMPINLNDGTNDEEALKADDGESVLDMNAGTNDEEADLANKGDHVFDFKGDVCTAIDSAFGLGDCAECERLAAALWSTTERFSDLAQRLQKQYELLEEIKAVFVQDDSKQSKLQEMYERRLKDPTIFQMFVRNVISRLGALPASTLGLILAKISEILREHNTLTGYVRLTFEVIPAYVISHRLPVAWGLDFQVFIDEMNRSDGEEDVQFKCASLICVAYAMYRHELAYDNLIFQDLAIKNQFDALEAAYLNISKRVCKGSGRWQYLRQILPVMRSMGKTYPLPRIDIGSLPSEVRTVWLSILCKLAQYHGRNTRSEESKSIVRDMLSALKKLEFIGNDYVLFSYCMSMLSYGDETNTNESVIALEHNIQYHTHKLEQWSDCPEMAMCHFLSLCAIYLDCCDNGVNGKAELLNSDVLWKLLGILHDWQQGMADDSYSVALSEFAHLLSAFSTGKEKDDVDVLFVWRDFAEIVKAFWEPILSGEKELEDWVLPKEYFGVFSYLSNTDSVSEDERCALLTEIAPTECIFGWNLCYVDTAWDIYKCNKELIPPHIRIFWAAQCIAGRTRELLSDDSAEMILAAQELIQEARDNGREVDEELVRLLYVENGLPADSLEGGNKSGKTE